MNIKRWFGTWVFVLTMVCATAWGASAQSNWYISGRGKVGNVICTLSGANMSYRSYFTHEMKTTNFFNMYLQNADTGKDIGYVYAPVTADFSQSELHGNQWSKWITGEASFATTMHLANGGDIPIMITYSYDGSNLPKIHLISLGDFNLDEEGIPGSFDMRGFRWNGYVFLSIW